MNVVINGIGYTERDARKLAVKIEKIEELKPKKVKEVQKIESYGDEVLNEIDKK